MTMKLPFDKPNDEKAILEDVARFRALSPEDRIRWIRKVINEGELMIERSPNPEALRAYLREEKNLERQAIKDFIARHLDSAQRADECIADACIIVPVLDARSTP
jgi:hypothetical protein